MWASKSFVLPAGAGGQSGFRVRFRTNASQTVERADLDAITILPAKLLGIDGRTGSLETGKDADFVVWSHDPLDPAAVAVSVHIDGNSVLALR